MIKSKKQMYIVIALFALFLLLGGTTYAWFNYRSETGSNEMVAGDIYLTMTEGNETLTLTNVFPETKEEARARNDNYITFTLNGLNESNKAVYYEILLDHGADKASPKTRYNDKDLVFDLIELDSNGNEVTYVVNAKSYDTLNNTRIWVDNIAANTTTSVTKKYKLRAWLSDKVIISDSEANADYNTTEFPNKYATVKVSVNGDMTYKELPGAYNMIKANVMTPTNPINFANISSSSNGQGLYILPGTENDTNPIYYYRGAVTDNNVIFGDYCWQIVRTTDTGGIKMIYNGAVTGNGETCENTTHADRIISSSAFNSQYNAVADVGYMKNARYTYTNEAGATGAIYGKNVEWDGTNYLVIEDTANVASSNTTKDNNHHYSCGTAGTTSCASVRYYYYDNNYITLTGGDFVEDAIYKMTGSIVNQDIDVVTRNSGYVLNNTDSTVKTAIESWFRTNLTNEVDNTKRNYANYLEDTVYCNDRSVKTTAGNTGYPTYQESGWNPSGGDLIKYLYFGANNRVYNSWYSTTNVPSIACPNETDRFSVSSSIAHLNYPVGLLTADEIVMAGAAGNSGTLNQTYYLYTGNYYWSLSPNYFTNIYAYEFDVVSDGYLVSTNARYSSGVRPVVSLKRGTEFESGGNGTPTNPYVVKY